MKKRIFYLDILRSYAIIMVVIVHSISAYISRPDLYGSTSWYINLILNAFARTGVPIFFMISGCLILSSDKTKDIKNFYKKIVTRLVVPLIFWNIFYFIYNTAMGYTEFDVWGFFCLLINQGTEYHLWYLYTLIGIYLVAPYLKIIIDNCNQKQQILLLFLTLLSTTICPFINATTPLYINLFDPLFNGYISLFLMGYILFTIDCNKKTVTFFSIIGIMGLLLSATYHHINSSTAAIQLYFNYGYSICHYALAMAVFVIVKKLFEKRVFLKCVATCLSKYSFGIYLIHIIVIDMIVKYFMIDASPIFSAGYIFIITMIVSLVITFVLSKVKFVRNIIS